jgi:TonB family protein
VVPEVIKKPVKKPPEPVKNPPEPVKKPPEPVKKPAVVKKPAEPTKKPIELGRRITAPNNNPPDPNRKRLSDEEIARRLALGATPSNRDLMPEGDALDFEVIRRRLYKAWAQPGSASSRISAEVEIRLNNTGTIISRRLLRPSGNPVMDKSVMEAVQSVFRIDGLNPGFVDRKGGRVTITFEVNAGAA